MGFFRAIATGAGLQIGFFLGHLLLWIGGIIVVLLAYGAIRLFFKFMARR